MIAPPAPPAAKPAAVVRSRPEAGDLELWHGWQFVTSTGRTFFSKNSAFSENSARSALWAGSAAGRISPSATIAARWELRRINSNKHTQTGRLLRAPLG